MAQKKLSNYGDGLKCLLRNADCEIFAGYVHCEAFEEYPTNPKRYIVCNASGKKRVRTRDDCEKCDKYRTVSVLMQTREQIEQGNLKAQGILKKLDADISTKKTELNNVNAEINARKKELEKVKGELQNIQKELVEKGLAIQYLNDVSGPSENKTTVVENEKPVEKENTDTQKTNPDSLAQLETIISKKLTEYDQKSKGK